MQQDELVDPGGVGRPMRVRIHHWRAQQYTPVRKEQRDSCAQCLTYPLQTTGLAQVMCDPVRSRSDLRADWQIGRQVRWREQMSLHNLRTTRQN